MRLNDLPHPSPFPPAPSTQKITHNPRLGSNMIYANKPHFLFLAQNTAARVGSHVDSRWKKTYQNRGKTSLTQNCRFFQINILFQ